MIARWFAFHPSVLRACASPVLSSGRLLLVPYAPSSIGSDWLRPDLFHTPNPVRHVSPRLSRIQSGRPDRTSAFARASVFTGLDVDNPLLESRPAELLT